MGSDIICPMPIPGWRHMNRWGTSEESPHLGMTCRACGNDIKLGEFVTLVGLGPGDDPDERAKAWAGESYNASAVIAHWACATGDPNTYEEDTPSDQAEDHEPGQGPQAPEGGSAPPGGPEPGAGPNRST